MYRIFSLLLLVELKFHPEPCLRSSEAGERLRYQAVTLSNHLNLYRQQICALFFLFSALGEEKIIMGLGPLRPFFFLLKRLYTVTIKAGLHDAQKGLQ